MVLECLKKVVDGVKTVLQRHLLNGKILIAQDLMISGKSAGKLVRVVKEEE